MLAALDLGTNNCRLVIVEPLHGDYRVVDMFTQSVKLGAGMGFDNPLLSEDAMARTLSALEECARRLALYPVQHKEIVATQACRIADNGQAFVKQIKKQTGLSVRILSRAEEAKLVAYACIPLMDRKNYERVLLFDIGGGSTEISWVNLRSGLHRKGGLWEPVIIDSLFLNYGVLTASDEFHNSGNSQHVYEKITKDVQQQVQDFMDRMAVKDKRGWQNCYLMGTAGTCTALASIGLGLQRYIREEVNGLWMTYRQVMSLVTELKTGHSEQYSISHSGFVKLELLRSGCAILEGILQVFPQEKLRVADCGIRNGLLYTLMRRHYPHAIAHREANIGKHNA